MNAVEFKLDAFQGPLDLMLYLISKHKLNIYDIEISLLLEQYLDYMNQLDEQDYESAGEFLEMAARLIYIKTASLLPQPEEAQELKKDLEGRIIEYSICKKAADMLKSMYAGNLVYVREPVPVISDKTYTRIHEPQVIYYAYMGISAKNRNRKPLRADIFSPIVSHKIVSVTSKIIFVLKKLYKYGVFKMSGLYENVTDKSEKVATFLAVLELTKSGRIYINDDNTEIRFIRKKKSVKTAQPQNDDDIVLEDTTENRDNDNMATDGKEREVFIEQRRAVKSISERVNEPHDVSYTEEHVSLDDNEIGDIFEDKAYDKEMILCEPVETFATTFKPNYWNRRKYYWGCCYVGDDGKNYFWHYG